MDGRDLALRRIRGAHRAHGGDRAFDGRREVSHLLLRLAAGDADARREQHDGDDRHCDHEHREQQQHGIDDDHRHEGAEEGEAAADRLDEPLREHGAQQGRVTADAAHEIARAALVELADRQMQQSAHERAATREHDALARAL